MAAPTQTNAQPAAATSSPIRGEIRSLTGLRIVAALWVVVFHFSYTPGNAYSPYWVPFAPLVHSGALGVDLFYVLSGFVITLTYLEKLGPRPSVRGSVVFWWARVCRIWPVYALVITLFGGWLLYKSTRVTDGFLSWQVVQPVVDLRHWAEQLLMVQLWHHPHFDGVSWVGPAWSISAEWFAYVCFPLLALLLFRLRRLPAPVTGALAVLAMVPIALACYRTGGPAFDWAWLARIAGGFLSGALTCLAVRRVQRTEKVERVAAVVGVLALVEILVAMWWGDWRGQGQGDFGGVALVLFPVLVGALALSPRGLSRPLSTRPMVHGGRISFSLYLVHVPVFEIFWTFMAWHPRMGPGTALGEILVPHVLVGVVVLAHLCHRFVEEPARVLLRGRGPGRLAGLGRAVPAVTVPPVPADAPARPAAPLPRHAGPAAVTARGRADVPEDVGSAV